MGGIDPTISIIASAINDLNITIKKTETDISDKKPYETRLYSICKKATLNIKTQTY